eukprot:gene9772-20319_t
MGFQFGILNTIETHTGTVCLILIVLFLVIFEYITEAVELLEEAAPSAHEMIQKVFKELMIMGLVSLIIVMFGTTRYALQPGTYEIVTAVDCMHILLFYAALIFVLHAFLLVQLSTHLAVQYEKCHYEDVQSIIDSVKKEGKIYKISKFAHTYFPDFSTRWKVEFKVFNKFFHETYYLPHNFAFSDYLVGCFEKYSLSLLNVGPLAWFSVIIMAILNMTRVEAMKAMHLECTTDRGNSNVVRRQLAASSTGTIIDEHCADFDIHVFLISGLFLVIFVFIVMWITRFYELRLLRRAGMMCTEDAIGILKKTVQIEMKRQSSWQSDVGDLESGTVIPSSRFVKPPLAMQTNSNLRKLSKYELKRNICLLRSEELAVKRSHQ